MAQVARGEWQRELWEQLLAGRTISSPSRMLSGRAAAYTGKYMDSFANMLQRAQEHGYQIERTPGTKGGEWSATYRIVGRPA